MTVIDRVIAKGQLVPFYYEQADVAASQSAIQMSTSEVRDVAATADDQNAANGYTVPFNGDIVSITVNSSAARSAGTLTLDVTVNGTVTGVQTVLNGTSTTSSYVLQPRDTIRYVAGDRIGVKLTTDASWAPVTADIAVVVYGLLYLEGI